MNASQPTYNLWHSPAFSTVNDQPLDSIVTQTSSIVIDEWQNGLAPDIRSDNTQPSSIIVTILLAITALIALGAPHLRRILAGLDTDLLGVRRRANAFESHTAAESRTVGMLLLLNIICQAVLLGIAIGGQTVVSNTPLLASLVALMTGYYLFQLSAYGVVGYVFTDNINALQWLKGFNISQGILGLLLIVPTIIVMYYPHTATPLLITCLIFYITARLAFIVKGFRIFYNQYISLIYFILYLCALEMIPVILILSFGLALNGIF